MVRLASLRRAVTRWRVYTVADNGTVPLRAFVFGPFLFSVERFQGDLRIHLQGPAFASRLVLLRGR